MQTEDAYSSWHFACPTLGIACVLMLRPISPELDLFRDFKVSNFAGFFLFYAEHTNASAQHEYINLNYLIWCQLNDKWQTNTKTYIWFL